MRKVFISLFMFVMVHASSYAAGPVFHFFFADYWLKNVHAYSDNDHNTKFILGNFFPSINMIGVQTSDEIAQSRITLSEVYTNPFPFVAGMQLHNYIEEQRDLCIHNWNAYALVNEFAEGNSGILLKLLEDELLYDSINPLATLAYLKKPIEEEILLAGSQERIHLWHFYLSTYFSMKPSELLNYLAQSNKGFLTVSPDIIKRWSQIFPQLAQSPEIRNYVTQLMVEISSHYDILKVVKK